MRGIAAIAVVLFHFTGQASDGEALPGYLAVDLFFVLSGFVLANSYQSRLQQGLGVVGFLRLRLLRLYPLYFVGLLLGLTKFVVGLTAHDPRAAGVPVLACDLATSLVMVPSPCSEFLFPLNIPYWSLFYEMLINAAYAVILCRAPAVALGAIMLVAGSCLVLFVGPDAFLNVGWRWDTIGLGAARAAYSFSAGLLICRFMSQRRGRSVFAPLLLCLLAAALLISAPAPFRSAEELAVAGLGFPLLIMAGIRWEAPAVLSGLLDRLGEVSYPIYVVHFPLIALAHPLMARFGVPAAGAPVLFVVALIPPALALSRIERRLRRMLGALGRDRGRQMAIDAPMPVSGPDGDVAELDHSVA